MCDDVQTFWVEDEHFGRFWFTPLDETLHVIVIIFLLNCLATDFLAQTLLYKHSSQPVLSVHS